LPPHIQEELSLSQEQERQLQDIEKDIRARVLKILTSQQKNKLQKLQQRGPGGPPVRNRGEPPDGDGPPNRPNQGEPPDDRQSRTDSPAGGIQWFATWESGLRAAQQSNRPILLVSAAPHCAGVPGIW
jgi:hypothetical protein